jgi:hypothetical protein
MTVFLKVKKSTLHQIKLQGLTETQNDLYTIRCAI